MCKRVNSCVVLAGYDDFHFIRNTHLRNDIYFINELCFIDNKRCNGEIIPFRRIEFGLGVGRSFLCVVWVNVV